MFGIAANIYTTGLGCEKYMPAANRKSGFKPSVFVVHGSETYDGKHVVYYSRTGDLTKGQRKKFNEWWLALNFAREKARKWGIKPIVSNP